MFKNTQSKYRGYLTIAYVFLFLALFTIVTGVVAYVLARMVQQASGTEVWLNAQALWIMRTVLLFSILAIFASLWFIPLYFYAWDSSIFITTTTVIGVVFAFIAFIYLLNAWLKGLGRFLQNRAVF